MVETEEERIIREQKEKQKSMEELNLEE